MHWILKMGHQDNKGLCTTWYPLFRENSYKIFCNLLDIPCFVYWKQSDSLVSSVPSNQAWLLVMIQTKLVILTWPQQQIRAFFKKKKNPLITLILSIHLSVIFSFFYLPQPRKHSYAFQPITRPKYVFPHL